MKLLPHTTLLFCSLALSVGVLFGSSAFAQSCSNEEGLLACIHPAVEDCRTGVSCETERRQGLTKQDVVEDAADKCCSKSPNSALKKCLKTYLRKIARAIRTGPGGTKPFLRESRQGVKELRKNGCSTGSLDT